MTDADKLVAGRELDALVAENVMEMAVYCSPKTLFHPMCALENQHIEYGGTVEVGNLVPALLYSADIWATWKMEETIEQRGLNLRYTQELMAVLLRDGLTPEYDEELWWALVHASPSQRCRAALKAVA